MIPSFRPFFPSFRHSMVYRLLSERQLRGVRNHSIVSTYSDFLFQAQWQNTYVDQGQNWAKTGALFLHFVLLFMIYFLWELLLLVLRQSYRAQDQYQQSFQKASLRGRKERFHVIKHLLAGLKNSSTSENSVLKETFSCIAR